MEPMDEKERELYSQYWNQKQQEDNRRKRLDEPLNLNLDDIKTRFGDIIENVKDKSRFIGKRPGTRPHRNPTTGEIDPNSALWTSPLGGKPRLFSGETPYWGDEAIPETESERLYGELLKYRAKKENGQIEPSSNDQNNDQESNNYWNKLSNLLKP